MSQEQVEEIKDHALELYGILVESAAHDHWDWNPLAVKAFEAAEAFSAICQERYPQTQSGNVSAVFGPKAEGSEDQPSDPISSSSLAAEPTSLTNPHLPRHPTVKGGMGKVPPSQ